MVLTAIFSIGALLFTALGIYTWNRINAINSSIQKGQALQVKSRDVQSLMKDMVFDIFVPKVYGQLKSFTYSPRTTVTVKKWRDAVGEYEEAFDLFIETRELLGVYDQEIIDQFDTAAKMHERAMFRLEQLNDSVLMILEKVGSIDEDRFDTILSDTSFIPFFEEFRDTSYYFVDSFESFMNYFIGQFKVYGRDLERQIYVIYGILALLITALGMTVSLLLSKEIIRKIDHVKSAFARVSRGDFSVKMNSSGNDEFSDLAEHFNTLTDDLKENVDTILILTEQIGSSISKDTDIAELLEAIVQSVVQKTQADSAWIHLVGTDPTTEGALSLKLRAQAGESEPVSSNVIDGYMQQAMASRERILVSGKTVPQLSSLMILPLVLEAKSIGTLSVAIRTPSPPFTDLGVTRLTTFAEFASLTLDNHRKYSELISKGEAEYQALQAQVQPHFIYNILNGLIGLNRMGAVKDLEASIIHLKEMLRYTQDSRRSATLQEEMDFVENYCILQKMRFSDRLHYSIRLDPEVAQVLVPRLLLQPLVENAIIHGIEPLDGGTGQLAAEGFKTMEDGQTMVTIVIRDNGVGFDLAGLMEKEHIGIGNVRRRFKYAFPSSAFNVKSFPGKGTEIRMTFGEMYRSR